MVTARRLGKAVLELTTDNTGVGKGLKQVETQLGGMGKIGLMAGGVAAGGLAAVAVASVNAAKDFEKTMSGVKAVAGATDTELKQLSDLALKLGKDTVFSASEAAGGIEELVKGGVSIADIMGGAAQATLNLASAGGIELAEAAEISANAMNMFGLKGTDMAMVSDQIAGAANASSLSVQDFRLSLAAVGAVANLAGQDFQSTATAIALMGAAGIKSSDAGTSLKTMLMNLVPTTKPAIKAMTNLGLITKDGSNKFLDAKGNFKSLAEISGELSKALDGLSESQKSAALEAIFGSDAIRAASVMATAGAEGFEKMSASMNKVTAAGVAATKLDNFAGSLEQLKGSLETLGIKLGVIIIPVLRFIVDLFTRIVNWALEAFDAIGKLSEPFKPLGEMLKDAGEALGIFKEGADGANLAMDILAGTVALFLAVQVARMLWQIPLMALHFGTWAASLVATGAGAIVAAAGVTILGLPLWLLVAAILAVIGVGILLIKNWDLVIEKAKEVAQTIRNIVGLIQIATNPVSLGKIGFNIGKNIASDMLGGNTKQSLQESLPGQLSAVPANKLLRGGGASGNSITLVNHGVLGINDAETWVQKTVNDANRRGTID